MRALTVEEQAIATKASQDLYRYERICEEHSAILRKDPEGRTKAQQEYRANAINPRGFMPRRDTFDFYIEESEKVLKKECKTPLDHLHVIYSAFFLCRLLMAKVSEHGEHVYLEFIRGKVELDKRYPYIFPDPAKPLYTISKPKPSDYPAARAARGFKLEEVMDLRRVPIQEMELIQYEHCPRLLQRETFVYFNEDEGEYEAFRIPAILTTDQERIFYVVYGDGVPEALAFTSVNLFDLLRTSERVLQVN